MPGVAQAASKLHAFLLAEFWDGKVLKGPDVGIRFNARAGRFAKSYLNLRWHDDLVYMQTQAYWTLGNWALWRQSSDRSFRELAIATSESLLSLQEADGSWMYPNPEWRGRIATVEGCFAALALLETFVETGDEKFLEGATRWHHCLETQVGFRRQKEPDRLAVNYFAGIDSEGGGVPNNATLVIWLLARLWEVTGKEEYVERVPPLVRWIAGVQARSGELPYAVGATESSDRPHFLCAQYNAFEFMDLVHYHRITRDDSVLPVMEGLVGFLAARFTDVGTVEYDCGNRHTEVLYYTVAVARAVLWGVELDLLPPVDALFGAYDRVLKLQGAEGGFGFYSRANYRVLTDHTAYPRPLSMMLFHFLTTPSA